MIAKQLLGKEQGQKTRSRLSFLSYIVLIPIVSIPKYLSMYPLQKDNMRCLLKLYNPRYHSRPTESES